MAVNLANLLLSGGSLLQSKYQHEKTMEKEELLFKEEMAQMKDEHEQVKVILIHCAPKRFTSLL
jgi:hypothetical protein